MGKMMSFITITVCLVILTGCWDRREIENTAFIIGVAVDFASNSGRETEGSSEASTKGDRRYAVTFQIVAPGNLQQTSQGGSTGSGRAYLNMTSEGATMMEIVKNISSRYSGVPFFEHLKIVLLSEDVAKSEKLGELLDFFIRYPEMRRNTKVFVVHGEARRALSAVPHAEKLPAMYLDSILENQTKTSRIYPTSEIGSIHESLLAAQSYTIQYIFPGVEDVRINGQAVISSISKRMTGLLIDDDLEGRNLITGDYSSGTMPIQLDDQSVTYVVKRADKRIKVATDDPEKLHFTVSIDVEGDIAESMERLDFQSDATIRMLEEAIEHHITQLTEHTVTKIQKQYQTDVLGLGQSLHHIHPKLWEQIRQDWESGGQYFASCEISILANATINSFGVTYGDSNNKTTSE